MFTLPYRSIYWKGSAVKNISAQTKNVKKGFIYLSSDKTLHFNQYQSEKILIQVICETFQKNLIEYLSIPNPMQ